MHIRRRPGARYPILSESTSTSAAASESEKKEISHAEQFVLEHQQDLIDSSHIWREVSDVFGPFGDGQVSQELLGFFQRKIQANSDWSQFEKNRQLQMMGPRLTNLADELATYLLIYASARSNNLSFPATVKDILRELKTSNDKIDDSLEYLLIDEAYGDAILPLPEIMAEGRGLRKHLVNDLVLAARNSPTIFQELSTLPDGMPQYARPIAELRKVAAVDWFAPDPEMSLLRGHMRALAEDDNAFLNEFAQAVNDAPENDRNGSERISRIKRMAEFAMAAQGIDVRNNPGVEAVLLASRDHWDHFAEIEAAYQEVKKQKLVALEREILGFVGQPHAARTDIRYPRSGEDFRDFQNNFEHYFSPGRLPKKTRDILQRKRHSLPTSKQISSETAATREAAKEFKPAVIKQGSRELVLAEFDMDYLLKVINGNKAMREEMQAAILALISDPLGPGTRKMTENRHLVVNGQKFRMRRFAPERHPALATSTINRWRVVYGLSDDCVALHEVLHHTDFDRRY
jgi:hypothetical protein